MKPRNNVDQNYRYNARKIELRLNEEQKQIFNQAFGYSRYIYNKALDEWKTMYEAWKEDNSQTKPNNRKVRDNLKASREEWEEDQLKMVMETSVEDLSKAFNMMWKGCGRYPQDEKKCHKKDSYVGIDLGVKDFAIINDDKGLYRKYRSLSSKLIPLHKRIDIYNKILSRKHYGSRNYEKARTKLNRTYEKISNIRKDFLHKLSTHITVKYKYICIEDLKVSNMMKNKNLSRHIAEQGWREFRTMLEYKAERYGCEIITADRWFPSSQICSCCGNVLQGKDKLKLSQRVYHCHECNNKIDRDYNAAVNLKLYGMRSIGQVKEGMDSF